MTDEQVGKILRLSDQLSEYETGLSFIRSYRTLKDAKKYLDELEDRIYKQSVDESLKQILPNDLR